MSVDVRSCRVRPRERPEPDVYFLDSGSMPAQVTLQIERPPGMTALSDNEYVAVVRDRLDAAEAECRERAREEGRSFLGVKAILAVNPWDAPRTRAPRRRLSPRFAFTFRAYFVAAVAALRRWRAQHAQCRASLRTGAADVVFPAGTWALPRYFGVRVAPT